MEGRDHYALMYLCTPVELYGWVPETVYPIPLIEWSAGVSMPLCTDVPGRGGSVAGGVLNSIPSTGVLFYFYDISVCKASHDIVILYSV